MAPLWSLIDEAPQNGDANIMDALDRAQSNTVYLQAQWSIGAHDILLRFTRSCALEALHLWPAPAEVVEFLKHGDPSLRARARVLAVEFAKNPRSGLAAQCAARAAYRAAYGPISTATPFRAARVVAQKSALATWQDQLKKRGFVHWCDALNLAVDAPQRAHQWLVYRNKILKETRAFQGLRLGEMIVSSAISRGLAPKEISFVYRILEAVKTHVPLLEIARWSDAERAQVQVWADGVQCGHPLERPAILAQ